MPNLIASGHQAYKIDLGRAQVDAKQHLTIGAAHLDTIVVVVAFNRERGEEQLTMPVGMLARRVIVGKLDANFVADALAPPRSQLK